jgi:hypothetical protein
MPHDNFEFGARVFASVTGVRHGGEPIVQMRVHGTSERQPNPVAEIRRIGRRQDQVTPRAKESTRFDESGRRVLAQVFQDFGEQDNIERRGGERVWRLFEIPYDEANPSIVPSG